MIALSCALALAMPQDPPAAPPNAPLAFERIENGARVRVDPIEGTDLVSVWLCVRAGSDHDPLGAGGTARVLGEVLRGELPPPAPERPSEIVVLGAATIVGVLVPATELGAHLDRVGRWLAGDLVADDDELIRARGRALIRADDELAIVPGPMLRELAERFVLAGTAAERPSGGDPAEIRALEPDAIRAAFRRAFHPARSSIAMVGGVDAAPTLERARAALAAAGDRPAAPLPVVTAPPAAGEVPRQASSERVDAPFVAYGFAAPAWGDAGYLPFLIAMEVVRARAVATFRGLRGGEVMAEFPPVAYDFLRMPKMAFIERRGRNGDPLDTVQAEIDSLVAGLRSGGAEQVEIQAALGVLLGTLQVPPFRADLADAVRRYPNLLHQRGYVVVVHELHGWPADLGRAIGSVPLGRVDRALARVLDPEQAARVALVPAR